MCRVREREVRATRVSLALLCVAASLIDATARAQETPLDDPTNSGLVSESEDARRGDVDPDELDEDGSSAVEAALVADDEAITEILTEDLPHPGRVVQLGQFAAIVDFPEPIGVGANVAIRVHVEDTCPYRVSVLEDDCRVVGRVVAVEGTRARVALGLNEVVEVGALAYRVYERRTASRIAPPRRGGYFELGAAALLGGTLVERGVVGFASMFAVYRGVRPVFIRLELEPTGGVHSLGTSDVITGFTVIAGLDSRLFEVGMGIGAARAATEWSTVDLQFAPALATPVVMRFGSLDGVHARVRLDFYAHAGRMRFGGGTLGLQFPTRVGAWIVATLGASLSGVVNLTAGYRRLVRGDNGPGSIYLVFSGGVVLLSLETAVVGSVGVEARFGRRR